jgi:hypothetical protein
VTQSISQNKMHQGKHLLILFVLLVGSSVIADECASLNYCSSHGQCVDGAFDPKLAFLLSFKGRVDAVGAKLANCFLI